MPDAQTLRQVGTTHTPHTPWVMRPWKGRWLGVLCGLVVALTLRGLIRGGGGLALWGDRVYQFEAVGWTLVLLRFSLDGASCL
jgi:hypothetical protein